MSEKQNDNRDDSQQSGDATERALQEELRREAEEGRNDVGDLGTNRNLTGSTTYVTLPDQKGDQSDNQSSRKATGSQGSNDQSYGSSRGDTQR